MIERYTLPEMGAIWSEQGKIELWLAVEKAVCEAWARKGIIPESAMPSIRTATCDIERMKEIERETDHDVIAFLRATSETAGDAARFIHLGLTSSDVIDTALALQVVRAADLLLRRLDGAIEAVGSQALKYRGTLMIGRTHGVHAEPITFGFKLAVWYDELRRSRQRLAAARDGMAVGKISGAVGTHANVPPDVEEDVCQQLGLRPAPVSTQIIQRDRHAEFITSLAILASSLDKFAVEIRHLARTEVRELEEPFDPGNQGSSAMPHKRNPHESERISGLARLVRGYALTAMENVVLWHERDISNSSAERVVFPDACILVDYMLHLFTNLVRNWVVYPQRMMANVESTGGAIFSQRAMLALIEAGVDRQRAYKLIQENAMRAWDEGGHLREYLKAEPDVASRLTNDEIDALFDYEYHLRYIDTALERVGLLEASAVASVAPGEGATS
ncbi:MAG TPA: adenylosuccinate lyase [Thermomicrobiales bacterium]|nr:adenylosuccinate lyase [Thermomicrobiales bacterium]